MANYVGDPYVFYTQQWLNNTYGNDDRFEKITENGKTGWDTITALTVAFQIELGVTGTLTGNFGPATERKFNTKYPNGIIQPNDDDDTKNNVYGIIQGALVCKGYDFGSNHPTCIFHNGTGNAIKKLKEDAGLSETNSTVTLNLMKALLSMDYFYSYNQSERTQNIIKMQRYLNNRYEDYIGIRPCDGVYGRRTSTALVFALQAEEGMLPDEAVGNFGPATKRCCPTIPYNNVEKNYYGNTYSAQNIKNFIKLLHIALYMNGYGNGEILDTIDTSLIKEFQKEYALPETGICDITTWLSVYLSCGDVNRDVKACDCATILTKEKAKTLYDNGYRYVGRYLSGETATGANKGLSKKEFKIAFDAGLRIFPIQQGYAANVVYFTEEQALKDVDNAYKYATLLGIPENSIIYFAVDCDPQDPQIISYIIPYFKKVSEKMKNDRSGKYRIGVYGTRNVCMQLAKAGYTVASFVADMSTGFSGNLGFSMPKDWTFDQFTTVTIGTGDGKIEIDKDGFSGRDIGVGEINYDAEPDYSIGLGFDTTGPQPSVMINTSNKSFNVYSSKVKSTTEEPGRSELVAVASDLGYYIIEGANINEVEWTVSDNKVGEIKPGDLYVRYECVNHKYDKDPSFIEQMVNEGDAAHKVIFRTEDGTVRYGYVQEYLPPSSYNVQTSERYGRKNFHLYNFDEEKNMLVLSGKDMKDAEFIVQRPLVYKRAGTGPTSGMVLGVLPKGTKLKSPNSTGVNNPTYIYFDYYYDDVTQEWELLDKATESGAFVSLDMENGVNGADRALW